MRSSKVAVSQAECGTDLRVLTKILMLAVMKMRLMLYVDGSCVVSSRARNSRSRSWLEWLLEEKVEGWKVVLSRAGKSEGGYEAIYDTTKPLGSNKQSEKGSLGGKRKWWNLLGRTAYAVQLLAKSASA